MNIIAGIDVGNSTTEVALACWEQGNLTFLESASLFTTGLKGTVDNYEGIKEALEIAASASGIKLNEIKAAFINDAAPVIGDLAMSTITETVITESAMIGHNPDSPGGDGLGSGLTISLEDLSSQTTGTNYIAIVRETTPFNQAAEIISKAMIAGIWVKGAIVENNDGVLISNRLPTIIPIIDEVSMIENVPLMMPAVVEVAKPGSTVRQICNPYGLATILVLSAEETVAITPVAMSLMGSRSAVVIKTPTGKIHERRIRAGKLQLKGSNQSCAVDLTEGAAAIMTALKAIGELEDVEGEKGTAVGGMLYRLKNTLGQISGLKPKQIKVNDLFAVDTLIPGKIIGAIAGECSLNSATGLAAMVWSGKGLIKPLLDKLRQELGFEIIPGGFEVHVALKGALTTPGAAQPLVVLDMGAGSIDAGSIDKQGVFRSVHLAGAGDLVTRLIEGELGLDDPWLAECVKRNPAARVESLFSLKLEDGTLQFVNEPFEAALLGRIVLVTPEGELLPVNKDVSIERLVSVRKKAKSKVFLPNAERALKKIAPAQNLRLLSRLILLGGCALDFEIPAIISEHFYENYGIVSGTANIRGILGPRNAVATGLILAGADKIP